MTSPARLAAAKEPLAKEPLAKEPRAEAAVLVELFTSQGCSSCPPADELLRALDSKLEANIIPLSFHVDYWNYIGWRDPYSSKRWSARQKTYANAISNGRAYTPQLVVNGAEHAVGSRFEAIKDVVATQLANSSQVTFVGGFERTNDREIIVRTQALNPHAASANLMIAVYENDLQTSVARGENNGKKLRNDFVVRELQDLGPLANGTTQHKAAFAIARDWRRENLGVVVFAQDQQSLIVTGAKQFGLLTNAQQ